MYRDDFACLGTRDLVPFVYKFAATFCAFVVCMGYATYAMANPLEFRAVYTSGGDEKVVVLEKNAIIPRKRGKAFKLERFEVHVASDGFGGTSLTDFRNVSFGLSEASNAAPVTRKHLEDRNLKGNELTSGKATVLLDANKLAWDRPMTKLEFDGRAKFKADYLCMLEQEIIRQQGAKAKVSTKTKYADPEPRVAGGSDGDQTVEYSFCLVAGKKGDLKEHFAELFGQFKSKSGGEAVKAFGEEAHDARALRDLHKAELVRLITPRLAARLGKGAKIEHDRSKKGAATNVYLSFEHSVRVLNQQSEAFHLVEIDSGRVRPASKVISIDSDIAFEAPDPEDLAFASHTELYEGDFSVRVEILKSGDKEGTTLEPKLDDGGGHVLLGVDLEEYIERQARVVVSFKSGELDVVVWKSHAFEIHRIGLVVTVPVVTELVSFAAGWSPNDPLSSSTLPTSFAIGRNGKRGVAVGLPLVVGYNWRDAPRASAVLSLQGHISAIVLPANGDQVSSLSWSAGAGVSIANALTLSWALSFSGDVAGDHFVLIGISLPDIAKIKELVPTSD